MFALGPAELIPGENFREGGGVAYERYERFQAEPYRDHILPGDPLEPRFRDNAVARPGLRGRAIALRCRGDDRIIGPRVLGIRLG